ncbi:MAG: helix-turn-helix domain-containing protein [Candidatus Thermoplasmatota archaeon]|nr:helix-turn-helix domain-containing protein [Candidatus Thermoplasmatota archaeon]MDD5777960.1 helix-turn-helix domain-containing protein [Candidatus Thermoplasmatota archaeon]
MPDITIRRRSDLRGAGTQAQIFLYLFFNREPKSLSAIARGLKMARQKIYYHIPEMLRRGDILEHNKKYIVNPAYTSPDCQDAFQKLLEDFLPTLIDHVVLPEGCDPQEAIMNILHTYPLLFFYETDEL